MKTMKKIFVTLFISGSVLSVFGQTDQGKFLLGGSSSLNVGIISDRWKSDDDKGKYDKTFDISLDPQVGIFVVKNLAVGLELQVSTSKTTDDDPKDVSTNTIFSGGPFVRYYFGSGKIKPFLHSAVGIGTRKYKFDPEVGNSYDSKYNLFGFKFAGGIALFLNDNVSLDLGLGYSYRSSKAKENNGANLKDITGSTGLNVGVVIIL
jgi:opacity protein-like surface antigen